MSGESEKKDGSFRGQVIEDFRVWLGLLFLLALTVAVSFADLGGWSTFSSFTISAMKTALIACYYMHLKREKGMTRIFAIAGGAWLVIFFSLTLSDFITRGWLPYPSRWPIFVQTRPALDQPPSALRKRDLSLPP